MIRGINNPILRRTLVLTGGALWVFGHLNLFRNREQYFPRFELLLSKSCPLNCKCCIHFLPDYHHNAEIEPAESVVNNMKKLLEAIERMDEVIISGGDAFSYPHLALVVKYLLTSDKIGMVTIVSTGAVSPDKDVLALLSNKKIQIQVDNYGKYSDKISEFTSLQSPSVNIEAYDTWDDYGNELSRGKNTEQLTVQYGLCKKERYCMMNGKVYACPRSAHGEALGFFVNDESEYIDLNKISNSKEVLSEIRRLRKISHLTACNHCDSCTEKFKTYSLNVRLKD